MTTEVELRSPRTRTLRRFIKNEKIEFAGNEWRNSFNSYIKASKRRHFLKDRLIFADTWMKVMQEQLNRGVLDPHHAYERSKVVSKIRPNPTEGKFIFGLVVSHWKYGPDFLRVTSDDGYSEERQKKDLELYRERYKYFEPEDSFF